MRERFLRALVDLFMPGGAVVAGTALVLVSGVLAPSYEALARVVPWAVLAMGLFLGLRFGRSRVVWASLILVLAERALFYSAWGTGADAGAARTVFNAAALLIPVNLALAAAITEREVLHPRNLRIALVVAGEAVLTAAAALKPSWDLQRLLEATLVDAAWINALGLPQPALLASLVCGVLLLGRYAAEPGPSRGGYVWALAAAWGALALGSIGPGASLLLSAGVVALIISEAESSHVMAFYDELTGLPGRRALESFLEGLTGTYAAAMVDVDRFKEFNDTYGHDVGDQVLRMVASELGRAGGGCRAFRYGGEEFALLYPGRELDEVMPRLEMLRGSIEEAGFYLRDEDRPEEKPEDPSSVPSGRERVRVTVSIGAARGDAGTDDPGEVLKASDAALYRAKRGGRNRVSRAE
ncbi:MAG: GGDEF domain-containing protein [bacterium]